MSKNKYTLFQVGDGWIVYNIEKGFEAGHTHLRNRASALAAIDFVSKGKVPKKCSIYYLISLIRISDDRKYSDRLQRQIDLLRGENVADVINVNIPVG